MNKLWKTVLPGIVLWIAGVAAIASPAAAAPAGQGAGATEAAAIAEATAIALAPPRPPAAGRCGPYYSIRIGGARASVRECRPNKTKIRVNGYVQDMRLDGVCAQVYATYNVHRGTDRRTVCGVTNRVNFTMPARRGTNAFIYLRLVRT